jgi:heptosyltransferase I
MTRGLQDVHHLRIILLTGLGDVVHGLPVVCAIRRARPDIRITWVVEPMPAAILEGHPAIDRVVVFRKKDGLEGVKRLRRELRGERPDLSINFNIYFKSLFPTLIARARRRLGFDNGRSRDGTWLAATERLQRRQRAHTQDMFLEFAEALGVRAEPLEWRLALRDVERHEQQDFFSRLDRPAAAIVPASANWKKDWVPERWAEVADRLYNEHGLQPVLVGGPSAREREIADTIRAHSKAPVVDALGDGVRRLLWLLGGSRVVIAPDTGPVHIARALGGPVVGLYGHTNPWRVGPYRAYEDLWIDAYTEPGESPDPSRFEPKHERMETITTDDVVAKVALALERYDAQESSPGVVASDTERMTGDDSTATSSPRGPAAS